MAEDKKGSARGGAEAPLRRVITDAQHDELKSEHGKVLVVRTEAGDVAFKMPRRMAYKQFLARFLDDAKKRPDALEDLARGNVVDPPLEEFDRLLEEYPGIAVLCGQQVNAFAGGGESDYVRK